MSDLRSRAKRRFCHPEQSEGSFFVAAGEDPSLCSGWHSGAKPTLFRACGHKWVVHIFKLIFRQFKETIFDIAQRQSKNCWRRNAKNSVEKMCNSFMSTRPNNAILPLPHLYWKISQNNAVFKLRGNIIWCILMSDVLELLTYWWSDIFLEKNPKILYYSR